METVTLSNSQQLVGNISYSAYNLGYDCPLRAAALVEAGWADLLVRALRARPDDVYAVNWASLPINCLLTQNHTFCRHYFIAAGAEEALQEALERHGTNQYIRDNCKSALNILSAVGPLSALLDQVSPLLLW